jgi:hypothetical protein
VRSIPPRDASTPPDPDRQERQVDEHANGPAFDAAGRLTAPPAPGARPRNAAGPQTAPHPREDDRAGQAARETERDRPTGESAPEGELPRRPRRHRRDDTPAPPPAAPRLLTLTLHRSGDSAQDRRRMRRLHGILTQYPGNDQFCFILVSDHRTARLDFPNHTIGINDEMLHYAARLVGEENINLADL